MATDTQHAMQPIIEITEVTLDDARVQSLIRAVTHSGDGGVVTFEGVVRDNARGRRVSALVYEAYPEMAEVKMAEIAATLRERWGATHVAMIHRVGRLVVGERSVVVVVACPHRAEAFDACRYAIDTLKATVPIWKKEIGDNGEEWVEG